MSNKTGFWESEGRNPLIAGFVVSALIMAVYGFLGNGFSLVMVFADQIRQALGPQGSSELISGNFLDTIAQTYQRYQVPILSLTSVLQFAVFIGLTALVFRAWHRLPLGKYFRISRPSPIQLLLAAIGTVFLLPVAIFLGELSSRAFPILRELESVSNGLLEARSLPGLLGVLFAIAVTPALCEEFLFRGYLHRTLSRRLSQPWSYLVSGLFFALIHQNYFGLATLALVGIYLGFVFSRFDNIWPGVLVHFMYNGILVLMLNYSDSFALAFRPDGFIQYPLVISATAGFAAICWLILRISRNSIPAVVPAAVPTANPDQQRQAAVPGSENQASANAQTEARADAQAPRHPASSDAPQASADD
ncbi:MAG: CPBP family intramembrane metalloprotease [Spirochaetes bacterium]|nr:CPBP family intramembrane metalloprotease [Spirochaetota bacterium]